jgi:orotate phosphoribosyltransferase
MDLHRARSTRAGYCRRVITPDDVERIFRNANAFRDGHFVLASGKHSPRYLEKFQVLQWPQETERLCGTIAAWWRAAVPDTVAGPTTGGIILAHEVARQLGTRAVYAERNEDRPGRVFRRGFQLRPGERVLVVDDIMTTGGSVQETMAAVRAAGAEVIGAAVLVDRSAGNTTLDVPVRALWSLDVPSYSPADCPLCRDGIPVTKPGTTPAQPARA